MRVPEMAGSVLKNQDNINVLLSLSTDNMDFTIKNINENIANISRKIGYLIIDSKDYNEYNMVRKLGYDNYPRFHIYLKPFGRAQGRAVNYIFNLHLDQKKPIYKGTHAHNGEYDGPVVETESDRIKELLI